MSPEPAPNGGASHNPNPNGGPSTESGKAISAQNAITHGLFAVHDVIRLGDEPLYQQTAENLHSDLAPEGALELNLVNEIHRAIWRLRRCGLVEARLNAKLSNGAGDDPNPDPNQDPIENEATANLQLSVDRARNQAHRLLHKSTDELRKLQTERQFRNNYLDPTTNIAYIGLCSLQTVAKNIDARAADKQRREEIARRAQIDTILKTPHPRPQAPGSFCKTPPAPETAPVENDPQIPRSAQCPCNSGLKYKRCCGKEAAPVLHAA